MLEYTDNKELLTKFKSGNPEAMTTVYRHYVGYVESIIANGFYIHDGKTRIWGNDNMETVKELVQDIFIKAFSENARTSYDGIRPYKTFLKNITKNVAIDRSRKNRKDALNYSDKSKDSPIPEETVEASEDENIYWKTCASEAQIYMQSLSDTEKQFVNLRYVQELPQRDIAKQMQITRWKVRSMENKIEKGLKKHLSSKNL
ncbi:MAG: sigma-70 family RNA polymerase sigma factor [Deltaproteobacteria bacterium]|nr:sigma-70 family RNA polymerase sigma factor [Deltaproteobacteria bacterium]